MVPTLKSSNKFVCEYCHYSSCRKSQYERHLQTDKHKILQNPTSKKFQQYKKYMCFCGKSYKHSSTLYAHKKICSIDNEKTAEIAIEEIEDTEENKEIKDKNLITMLLKQNTELIELLKNGTNNNTNCHNKTFNLNLFLNETCKDALNITDFVSSIKPSLEDLENTGRHGYIEGISKIIVKNLNNLGEHQRPIHCSDQKREVLYIKNDNQWIKESEEKPILTKAIKVIANENIKQIKNWREKNPDCTDAESKKNNLYLQIVSNSMNGSTVEESSKNIHKIISNVAKETIIQKD